jgi:hypothetical protein
MKPLPQQFLELAYWTPWAALILISLAIITLKRLTSPPRWVPRVRSSPFYLISFPVVTLVMGIEISLFAIHALYAWFARVEISLWPRSLVVLLFGVPQIWPNETVSVLVSGCAVIVALVTSISAIRHGLSHKENAGLAVSKFRQLLKGFVLVIAFAWVWLSLRYVIINFERTRFMNLRIVSVDSRHLTIKQQSVINWG